MILQIYRKPSEFWSNSRKYFELKANGLEKILEKLLIPFQNAHLSPIPIFLLE